MKSIIGKYRKPDITFYRNGRIDITSRVVKMLDLHEGDSIDVGEEYGDYYLYVRHRYDPRRKFGAFEATAYPSKTGYKNFRAYSKKLCNALFGVASVEGSRKKYSPQIGSPLRDNIFGEMVPLILRDHYMVEQERR